MESMRIELQRAGMSRVSEGCIPLVARILTPTGYGTNLLAREKFADVECAKATIQARDWPSSMVRSPRHPVEACTDCSAVAS